MSSEFPSPNGVVPPAAGIPLHHSVLPSQLAPLAYLTPEIGNALKLASYFVVGSLGMFVWDILTHSAMDWKLIFGKNTRINLPIMAYFVSRICSLGFIATESLFLTAPISNCTAPIEILKILFLISTAATNLLFFFRIRAIYNRNPIVVRLFFILWLISTGCCSTEFLLVGGTRIGPTNFCIFDRPRLIFGAIPAIAIFVYSILVFLAISARIQSREQEELQLFPNNNGLAQGSVSQSSSTGKDFMSGRKLPRFSRALFIDGQVFYLIAFLTTLMVLIMFLIPSTAPPIHLMMIGPHTAIVNSMASFVFRDTRFGIIREESISTASLHSQHESGISSPGVFSGRRPALFPTHYGSEDSRDKLTLNDLRFGSPTSIMYGPGGGIGYSPSSPRSLRYAKDFPPPSTQGH